VAGNVFSPQVTVAMVEPVLLTATFQVNPALVRVVDATAAGGGMADVPIELVANGNENALGFSLVFDPSLLTFETATPVGGATNGLLLPNTNQTAVGRIGLGISLPSGQLFPAGTQHIMHVLFAVAPLTNSTVTAITFSDEPTRRELVDEGAIVLPAVYQGGTVSIAPVQYEGDVAPRPAGDLELTIADWVQAGRFVAALEAPASTEEFMRADCAPRATLGNGILSVTDWVQAGRYAIAEDPPTPAGGLAPANPGPAIAAGNAPEAESGVRALRFADGSLRAGQDGAVSVELESLGNENALGFSVNFDPEVLMFASAEVGGAAAAATLNVNSNHAAAGRIGLILALPYSQTFAAGTQEVAVLGFQAAATPGSQTALGFGDEPVWREVSDSLAGSLSALYSDVVIPVGPLPRLNIDRVGDSVRISWPRADGDFRLQSKEDLAEPDWSGVDASMVTNGDSVFVIVPITNSQTLYRLKKE
jgi:hypothetical protein